MKTRIVIASLLAVAAGCLVLGEGVMISGASWNAGWPHDLADIEGTWVLDCVRGSFEVSPPETLVFSAGPAPGLVSVSDGARDAEFSIEGLGRFVFADGQHFEPLLPAGATDVYTMTQLFPPLPAWDHLTFFPDGSPIGHDSERRLINYERE